MVESSVRIVVERYLSALRERGIALERGVVFGSQARGTAQETSDIDLLVICAAFDGLKSRETVYNLWRLARHIDARIEPIPCGMRQGEEDDSSAIIEMARREGEVVGVDISRLA